MHEVEVMKLAVMQDILQVITAAVPWKSLNLILLEITWDHIA